MSDKIALTDVAQTLKTHKLEPSVVREILEELSQLASDAEADKAEPTPRAKQQYVVVVADAAGKIKDALTGWVLQIAENESPASIMDRVMKAAHEFNASKKGRLLPVKTVGEAFESASRKAFKNAGVSVKTKTPIYLIPTTNQLSEPPSA